MLKIFLKDPSQAEIANQKLKALGWDYKKEGVVFNSPESIDWQYVDYYNSDAHLSSPNCVRIKSEMTQGVDRDVTAEECMKYWNIKIDGVGATDITYNRCPEKNMLMLVLFISGNEDMIDKVQDGLELLEKSGMDTTNPEGQLILETFQRLEYEPEPPALLPEDKRTDRSIQGGVMKAKYWGSAPSGDYVHVIFGAVDDALFMKDRQYQEDIYNSLYRCDDGRGVLMVSQIPIDNTAGKVAEAVFNRAWEMGVRENPYYFIHTIYRNSFKLERSKSTIHDMADSFMDTYSLQELKDRIITTGNMLNTQHPAYHKVKYDGTKRDWNRFSYPSNYENTTVCLLSALYVALHKQSPEMASEAVNELTIPVTA